MMGFFHQVEKELLVSLSHECSPVAFRGIKAISKHHRIPKIAYHADAAPETAVASNPAAVRVRLVCPTTSALGSRNPEAIMVFWRRRVTDPFLRPRLRVAAGKI